MPASHAPVVEEATMDATQVAALFLNLVPVFFRMQRAEVKNSEEWALSVPQVRTLRFIHRRPDVSLSDVARHLDVTLPAASKLVDHLMQLELLTRAVDSQDRRRAVLHLTDAGCNWLQSLNQAIQNTLAARLAHLSEAEAQQCAHALVLLHEVLTTHDSATAR